MSRAPDRPVFTAADRHLANETKLALTSVGVDIGSSTSLLVFSRLELELDGQRYVPVRQTVIRESDIRLTPYSSPAEIDAKRLGDFIRAEYEKAGIRPGQVDTGVLILTGTALRRRNARAIADLFADEAGRFVAVSAGHHLEATLAAYGSGAAALSERDRCCVLNIDIGGGTTKFSLCRHGKLLEVAALDVGARLVTVDEDRILVRLEPSGARIGQALGLKLEIGKPLHADALERMAGYIADRIAEAAQLRPVSETTRAFWLTPPLLLDTRVDRITFSGGVSEFIHGRQIGNFGDLGQILGRELRSRTQQPVPNVCVTPRGIRSTVIGASQHTVQVSGNTIFISPEDTVPLRNVPVVVPRWALGRGSIDSQGIQRALATAMQRLDVNTHPGPIAVGVAWEGMPRLGRLEDFCEGLMKGLCRRLSEGHPLVLACNRDVGGLLGMHLKQEMRIPNPVVSIDAIDLREFDFIDVGSLIPGSGAVPVVIKSLVFADANASTEPV